MGFITSILENDSMGFETLPAVDCDSILKDESVDCDRCCENTIEDAFRVTLESTRNYNALKQACIADEITCLESSGQVMVYEGAKLDAFIDKAKDFFSNMWKKVQEMFKKVLMQFSSWFQEDKAFLNKYKKDIQKAINTKGDFNDKEISVYDYVFYSNADAYIGMKDINGDATVAEFLGDGDVKNAFQNPETAFTSEISKLEEINKNWDSEATKTALDKLRGKVIAADKGEVSSSEFKKEYLEVLRGDSSKTDKKLSEMIAPAMKFLEDSAKIKTGINKMLTVCKKSIDDAIKKCESYRKTLNKLTTGDVNDEANKKAGVVHTLIGKCIDVLKGSRDVIVQTNGMQLQCLKECSRQSKSICVKVVSYRKPKDESATYGGSALGSVSFE